MITKKIIHKDADGSVTEVQIGVDAENVTEDENHIFVTEEEKSAWNENIVIFGVFGSSGFTTLSGEVIPNNGAEKNRLYIDTAVTLLYVGQEDGTFKVAGEGLKLGETSSTAYRGDRGKAAYDHSQAAHAPSNAQKNVQIDWSETDTSSDAYIKNKPSVLSFTTIYEGEIEISAVNTYALNTSMLGFSYVEFMGKDSDGGVWSEKINPTDFLAGQAFSVHGIKFSGVGSGPNITVTQNTSSSSIYKIFGVK